VNLGGSGGGTAQFQHPRSVDGDRGLAEQRTGTRQFVDGTLYDVLTGRLEIWPLHTHHPAEGS
jgi:hypothetical protein